MELHTGDKKKSEKTVDWRSDLLVPAPAYSVNIADWPDNDTSHQLKAWYWTDSWEKLLRTLMPEGDRFVIGQPGKGIIENIRWEENYPVGDVRPEGVVPDTRKCLVIRARYVDNQPVYIGLKEKNKSEFKRVRSEHRFYDKAGKSTACFYGLDPTETEVELVFIPVAAFKAVATQVDIPNAGLTEIPDVFHRGILKAIHGK
jgi:hypothetical protein